MKWTLTLFLFTVFVAVTQAAIIPHFFTQDDEPIYEASTDLIKHCGDDNDLLT